MAKVTLGTTITAFLKLKQKISKKNKEVDELKSEVSAMEKEIIKELEAQKSKGSDVKIGSVKLKESNVWSAKDWKKVWDYILKKKDTNLLQKRLAQTVFNEYLEEGIKIPGTEKMIKKTLSVGFKKGV